MDHTTPAELAALLTNKNPVASGIRHQIIVAGVVEDDGRHFVIDESGAQAS